LKRKAIHKITIDYKSCKKCKTCVDACFLDVFRWDEKEELPVAAYPQDCVWCLDCENACPANCIDVSPTIKVLPGRIPAPY
jgi:NAD-dependent dihydropyrimidine dehydrogenase PreA subunit